MSAWKEEEGKHVRVRDEEDEKVTLGRGGTPLMATSSTLSEGSRSAPHMQRQADPIGGRRGSSVRRLFQAKEIAKHKKPKFRTLPAALLWPNPEVLVFLVFSAGLVEAASAVLGALAGGAFVPTLSLIHI